MNKRVPLLFLVSAAAAIVGWAVLHFEGATHYRPDQLVLAIPSNAALSWAEAVEKVKADRGELAGGSIEIPPELKHYEDRHWFLATQVAEVEKHHVQTCQDFLDLAGMIERGEMVAVPGVTESYVLFGVGERADDDVFSRYEDDRNVELYNEAQLADAYKQLEEKRSKLESEIKALNVQASKLKKNERSKRSELQKQIAAQQQELNALYEDKALLDEFYGQADTRRQLFRDYESLQSLAKNFRGRSYDLNNPSDRQALRVNMLSSLRPQALKILEEVASAYHQQFDRPLPVSSLVRPEQYQRALRRVNRNAVLIETPPHSTGLAFDVDYRYMSAAEQTFVMAELARIKKEGRIEVIRERSANYHVFSFIDGARPSDELIAASLEKASESGQEAHHAVAKPAAKLKSKSPKARAAKHRDSRAKSRKHRH